MIRARCLHGTGHLFKGRSVDLAGSPRSGHKFYSAFTRGTVRHEIAINPIIRASKPWRINHSPLQRLSGSLTLRFASTTPVPPPNAEIQLDYVPPPQPATPGGGELLSDTLDEAMSSIPTPVYEHLGFLKEMGLDYGWGTTAFMETVLEHVYIYLGTPWWASIGITIVLIRAAFLKFFIDAADIGARRQIIKPLEEPITARMTAAKAEKNSRALHEAWRERSALHKSAGITWWKAILPLIQIPIGFGIFRLIRGMATLPVPGFDTGGILWFHDLTVSDPYYLLPVVTSWAYYYAFKKGGETSNSDLMSERSRKVFLYVLPIGGGLFMLGWPAGLQLTFCTTSLLAALQATLFKSDWFRNLVGIQALPKPDAPKKHSQSYPRYQAPSSNPSKPETETGVVGYLKGAVSDIKKSAEKFSPMSKKQSQRGRRTKAEKRHATTYERRRQREIAQERTLKREEDLERRQEQVTKDREREEGLRRRAQKRAERS